MAKPQHPLLSFGARGTIADTLTFQKRGTLTIVRQKPIPKDPKSPAQLARRQIYRDAVAAWHSLTPEEKESWRGVCHGLTAYQCFMKSELVYVPPVPPPEEYIEEQTQYNDETAIQTARRRGGQRLIIPNREVTKLGFWLRRRNNPTGDVTFEIRRISPDELICSKVWGDASALQDPEAYEEVTFDTPTIVDEEVRICIYFPFGNLTDNVRLEYQNTQVKDDEYYTYGGWTDWPDWDCAYRYKYYLP